MVSNRSSDHVFFAKLLLLAGYLCARQQSAWTNPCKLEKTLVDFALANLSTFSKKLPHSQTVSSFCGESQEN